MAMAPENSWLVAIEHALAARQGRQEGRELRFLCPAHEDRHPSARWNPDKQSWYCDTCKEGGGWRGLADLLGLDLAPAKDPLAEVEAVYDYRDAGLASRLLFIVPEEQVRRWTPEIVSPDLIDAFNGLCEALLALEPDKEGQPVDLPLDEEALTV
jgi:hypothetical protein